MPKPETRLALREALRDELSTIRVLNGALIAPGVQPHEYRQLTTARADALIVVRRLLTQLHPCRKVQRKAKPCRLPN
jgi:hypothetical protein